MFVYTCNKGRIVFIWGRNGAPPELGKKEGKNVKRREKSEERVNKGKICKHVTYL